MFTLQVKLEDLQKPQASLSTQAADLGDEVQVDDQCDVRPSAFTFTLGTQSTSLAPLCTALDIWHEMATQVCFLHFCCEHPALVVRYRSIPRDAWTLLYLQVMRYDMAVKRTVRYLQFVQYQGSLPKVGSVEVCCVRVLLAIITVVI